MKKFGAFIAKQRILVLIVAIALLIPSVFGMIRTRINYDVLTYLPEHLNTMKGQKIMEKDFSTASTAMLMVEDMQSKDVVKLKEKISDVKGVEKVIWIDDVMDISIPKEMLPDKFKKALYSKNSTLLVIKFKESAAAEGTFNAIADIKKIANKQCFLAGAAAIVEDTKCLAEKETPIYVLIAVIFATVVMMLGLESFVVPFIFLIGIAFPIIYNLGSNIFLGEISYITKALAAVLQLGVTMDYSIFLFHRYDEEKSKNADRESAMAEAIANTFTSVTGSSLTTIAGFLALCTMELRLGKDIGIVMAKGVLIGVVSTITILPALLLVFDGPIHKFTHRALMPEFKKVSVLVTKHYKWFIAAFVLLFIPFIFAEKSVPVYYNLDESLPKDLASVIATNKLKQDYNMTTTHFILVKDEVNPYKMKEMVDKIEKVDGIEDVLAYDKFIGNAIPEEFIPKDIKDIFKNGGYNLVIANSKYKAAREEENLQISELTDIIKSYDKDGIIAGEGPLTKDLIEIADNDFKNVNFSSIIAIFAIVLFVFMSGSIPVLLILAIEFAITVNMGIPYFTGSTLPFIAGIVIGTIQLGSTVDYAILMTSRFREEMRNGLDKFEAMRISIEECAKSIATSAFTFFGATIGVYITSKMELIKSLCLLMARGALISMVTIIFILPGLLLMFEKVIAKTSKNWRTKPFVKNKEVA